MSSKKYDMSDNSLVARLELLKGNKTQKEFAEWLGESTTTVNGYFTGSSRPKIEFLRSLITKGINLNWFLAGTGSVYAAETHSNLTAEEQIFLHEFQEEDNTINVEEALKSFRQLKTFQQNTNASETQMRIGLEILKLTHGSKIKKQKKQ